MRASVNDFGVSRSNGLRKPLASPVNEPEPPPTNPIPPPAEPGGEPHLPIPRKSSRLYAVAKWTLIIGCLVLATQLVVLAVPTTVIPPVRTIEPVRVFLVDYGRTPAIVLPITDSKMAAYAYGDWNYYALRHQGPLDSIAALLWPTRGTLGRREITGPLLADVVRSALGNDVEEIHALQVERVAVDRLRATLDRAYHDRFDTAVKAYGMVFVHHPQRYTYWSNSNHMTATWLEELGCDVRGPAFASWWRVQ